MATGTSWSRCALGVVLGIASIVALSACGGGPGSTGGSAAPGNTGSPPPSIAPAPDTPPPGGTSPPGIDIGETTPVTPAPVIGAVLPEPLPDADRDGIPDHLDPYPQETPVLAPLAGPGAIHLDRAWSELDGQALDGLAFAGRTLYLEGRGLDGAAAGAWVVFQTLDGRTAVRPEERAGGGWQLRAPDLVTGVHVVLDNRRSGSLDLLQPDYDAPLIFPPQAGFEAGASAVVQGRNLRGVTHATLGDTALQVLETGADFLRLQLPPYTLGNTLRVAGPAGSSNPVTLKTYRQVVLELDGTVPATPGRPLRGFLGGAALALAPGQPATLKVPAHRPVIQLLDLELPSGQVLHGAVGVAIWPDATQVTVSLASTLVADLARVTQALPEVTAGGWSWQREVLEDAWSLPEAREFEAGLAAYLADGTVFPRYELRGRVMDAMFAPALDEPVMADAAQMLGGTTPEDVGTQILSEGLGPAIGSGRRLDDAIPFTVSLGAPERPDMPQGTYAQFTVTTHEDTFLLFNVCRFPGGLAPSGITPSDLCVQNSTPMPASAAVYMPNRFTYGAPYTPRDSDRVRSHIDRLIDGNAFRNSAIYLTSDRNVPLCGMRPCYVELLTGGLGFGHKVSLSTREESIVQMLRLRWILEEFVLELVFELFGLESNASVRSCVTSAITADPGFLDAVGQFVLRTRGDPSGAASIFEETVGKHVIDMSLGLVSNTEGVSKLFSCVKQEIINEDDQQLLTRVATRLSPVAKSLKSFFRVLTVINKSMYVGGILLTPEKILFKVVYRGEITDFGTGAADPFSQTIDLYDVRFESGNDRMLRIYGDWIGNTALTSEEDSFFPTLVFLDRRGATRRFPLDASHLIDEGGAQRQLAVSLPGIGFGTGASPSPGDSLSGLDSGPLEFWLEYPGFAGYPAEVLRIPSATRIDFRGIARITAFDPPGAPAGSRVTATGNRLDDFADRPVVLLVESATGSPAAGSPLTASVQGGKLRLTIPENVAPGRYRVDLRDGRGQLDAVVSEADLVVAPVPDPHLTLSDWRGNDDSMRVELLAAGSSFPVYDLEVPDSSGRSVATLPWDRGAPVDELRVVCEDPGNDATCTYRLSLERAQIRLPTGELVADYASQLLRGEDARFELVF
jgi:hypothetical protein